MLAGMKTLATMVTERGQVSIPAEIRKKMKLKPGQRILWELTPDGEKEIPSDQSLCWDMDGLYRAFVIKR